MRKLGAEVATGVVIFLAIVIFIAGYLYLKEVPFKAGRYFLTVYFDDVTGLEKSDFVSVSGLRIGRVKNLKLDDFQVMAKIEINPGVKLPKDSRAIIKSFGMVGEKYVEIVPGVAPDILQDGDSIKGTNSGDLTDISGSMDGLVQQAQELINKLRNILESTFDNATQRNLKESVFHLRNISAALDRNSNNNIEHLENILANLDSISNNLSGIIGQRRHQLEASIDNFYNTSHQLQGLTDKLDSSLTSVQALLSKIENEEGALGKVISNDEFYNDIRHLTTELDALVQDLKKRPQKYLNLGFIKFF
jgi:phospholipid/cholesterol/gamma-HCH transport system substrate-binding protein